MGGPELAGSTTTSMLDGQNEILASLSLRMTGEYGVECADCVVQKVKGS